MKKKGNKLFEENRVNNRIIGATVQKGGAIRVLDESIYILKGNGMGWALGWCQCVCGDLIIL